MIHARLRVATMLLWRHLKPALLDPRQLPALISRLYGIWCQRGLMGALEQHAPPLDLYGDYQAWLAKYDAPSPSLGGPVVLSGSQQPYRLTVLALHDGGRPQATQQLIDDFLSQSSDHCELLLGTSTSFAHPENGRIRVVTFPTTVAGPAVSIPAYLGLQTLLAAAQGEYIFHAHGMRLHQHFAARIEAQTNAGVGRKRPRLVYWDHDEINAKGNRGQPEFKPDWNPALLRSRNYIAGAFAVAIDHLRNVGSYSVLDMRSGNWDLALRAAETLGDQVSNDCVNDVVHIPQVLTHRINFAGSASAATTLAPTESVEIVDRHLLRTRRAAYASIKDGMVRLHYQLPDQRPRVSVIIPTRDCRDLLKQAIDSVRLKTEYANYEIIVVDNQSQETETREYFQELVSTGVAKVIGYDAPFNYSAINNAAAQHATGEILCFMNNDIEVISPDWMGEMVGHALQEDTGVVGTLLFFPNGTIQHAGVVLGIGGICKHVFASQPRPAPDQAHSPHWRTYATQNYSAVTAACIVVRKAVFDEVDGFDESFAVAMNDIDLCLRIQHRGYRNLWTPYAEMYHHESASRGHDYTSEKYVRARAEERRMIERWGTLLKHDPAYNPNLALNRSAFMLAWPPRHQTNPIILAA